MKIPWKLIIFILLALLAIALIAYGGSGYKAVRDLLVSGENEIQDTLVKEVEKTDQKLTEVYQEISKNKIEIAKLKANRTGLEKEKINIVVPANISDLVVAFNRKGFRARARSVLPSLMMPRSSMR